MLRTTTRFSNYLYDSNGSLEYSDLIKGQLPSNITIYAAKADYTKPLGAGSRFEAGWKSAFTKRTTKRRTPTPWKMLRPLITT
ncbi:MAG: outer membrane beta-barrel protein [Haliscomenobacter sp.]|nr:outer membrane beta-barrel protein [Haliscomenobacter sp.]